MKVNSEGLNLRATSHQSAYLGTFTLIWNWLLYIYIAGLVLLAAHAYLPQQESVGECCIERASIENINQQIRPILSKLVTTKFFRTFRVNLQRECPFWVQKQICQNSGCGVLKCDDKDIPLLWRQQVEFKEVKGLKWDNQRTPREWHIEQQTNDRGQYVDLQSSKEAFTGFNGSHIWKLIYSENCFLEKDSCREQKALYRLISGLHTSITVQLCQNYADPARMSLRAYRPNLTLFKERLRNKKQYISNLYFTFNAMLRALQIYFPFLKDYQFATGHESDQAIRKLIDQLSRSKFLQSPVFLEEQYFGERLNEVKDAYKKYIHNISSILDCVSCEKCKVYGKLQIYGIGSTARALFKQPPTLKRNELIAFINTIQKLSNSIEILKRMQPLIGGKDRLLYLKIWGTTMGAMLLFLRMVLAVYRELPAKVAKMFRKTFHKSIPVQ